jgi:hypothetical protein
MNQQQPRRLIATLRLFLRPAACLQLPQLVVQRLRTSDGVDDDERESASAVRCKDLHGQIPEIFPVFLLGQGCRGSANILSCVQSPAERLVASVLRAEFEHALGSLTVNRRSVRAPAPPKRIKLATCWQPRAHELHFVHHPETVVVNKSEREGPLIPTFSVTTIERTGQQHVLGAHENGILLGTHPPLRFRGSAHQQMQPHGLGSLCQPEIAEDAGRNVVGLFDEYPHRKAIDQPSRRCRAHRRVRVPPPPVQPAQQDGGCLSRAGRNDHQLRKFGPCRERDLIRIRIALKSPLKKLGE